MKRPACPTNRELASATGEFEGRDRKVNGFSRVIFWEISSVIRQSNLAYWLVFRGLLRLNGRAKEKYYLEGGGRAGEGPRARWGEETATTGGGEGMHRGAKWGHV